MAAIARRQWPAAQLPCSGDALQHVFTAGYGTRYQLGPEHRGDDEFARRLSVDVAAQVFFDLRSLCLPPHLREPDSVVECARLALDFAKIRSSTAAMRASLSVFASSATTRTPWIMLCSAGADERLTPWNVFNRMPKAWSMMATASASLELKWWYRAFLVIQRVRRCRRGRCCCNHHR